MQNNQYKDIRVVYGIENQLESQAEIKSEDFLIIIQELEKTIRANKQLKSFGVLLDAIKKEVDEFKKNIEFELSKNWNDIAKEIKTV